MIRPFVFYSGNTVKLRQIVNETNVIVHRFVCIPRPEFKQFFRFYLPIFDLLFVALIPCILMVISNIGIIRTAVRSNILFVTSRKQKRNNRLTIMLLSVIFAFLLLTCPSVIFICLNRLLSSTTFTDTKLVLIDLCEALWYTKHALNFILYTLSGQDFRREFRKLISCSRKSMTLAHRGRRLPKSNDSTLFFSKSSFLSTHRGPCVKNSLFHFTEHSAVNDL